MKGDAVSQLERQGATVIPFKFVKNIPKKFGPTVVLLAVVFFRRLRSTPQGRICPCPAAIFYRRHLLYLQFLRETSRGIRPGFFDRCARCLFSGGSLFVGRHQRPSFLFGGAGQHHQFPPASKKLTENQIGGAKSPVISIRSFPVPAHFLETLTGCSPISQKWSRSQSGRSACRKLSRTTRGIHNYMLRENLLPRVSIHENRRGAVLTTGTMGMADFRMNHLGQLLDETAG